MTHEEALASFLNTSMENVSPEVPQISEEEHLVALEKVRVRETQDGRVFYGLQFRVSSEDTAAEGADRGRVFFDSIWPTRENQDTGEIQPDQSALRKVAKLVAVTIGASNVSPLETLETIASSPDAEFRASLRIKEKGDRKDAVIDWSKPLRPAIG